MEIKVTLTGGLAKFDRGNYTEYASWVCAVCDYYGPTDLRHMQHPDVKFDGANPHSAEAKLLGAPPLAKPELEKISKRMSNYLHYPFSKHLKPGGD